MKLWVVMLMIMIAIVAGGFYLEQQVLKITASMAADLDVIERDVQAQRWPAALSLCQATDRHWSAKKDAWSPFIHNHELDSIALSLAKAVTFLEARDESAALAEISTLKVLLVQMHHQEILSWQNIF